MECAFCDHKSSDRVTALGVLRALAMGALLGGSGMLCSRWLSDSPNLCTALQSAVSTMALTALAFARPQDLVLDIQRLQTCPELGHRSLQETQDLCWPGTKVQPGFAAS